MEDTCSPPGGNKSSPNFGNADFWVVRLDAGGNKLWDQSFGGPADDLPAALAVTTDGGVIIGGRSFSGIEGNKTSPNYGACDFWVVKLAPEQPSLSFSDPPFGPRGVQLSLRGVKNLTYEIEWSNDLTNWATFQTNRMTNSVVDIVDEALTDSSQRFYRARQVGSGR